MSQPSQTKVAEALCAADSILSLMHYRHRDRLLSDQDCEDVKAAVDKLAALRPWYETFLPA